ncbi:hypothetical protein [Desulfobacula toluolica]|uniref:Thymidylate kinase n=1 Tax=Desulfobacula toluolica (strain DSM 7467 / Tol2) TaxID=651182 RepID=K0NP03_DESTT|nr:hypothetical protein [Desulfobacula toluolica]CCK81828.1 uncharacterized protein TOL2_C36720 [Desulfobacula toluolica Tol2]
MYIEFAGLPASGKTTLSSALNKHLKLLQRYCLYRNEAIIQCIKKRDDGRIKNMVKLLPSRIWLPFMGERYILPEFVTFSSRHLELIALISKALAGSNLPKLLIESIWNTIVRTFSEVHLISQYLDDSDLVIMDEAFSQRCFTLFAYMESTVSDELITRYAKLAPISNHLFWVVTDPKICVERFMQRLQIRPLPFGFQTNSKELLEEFESGHNVLKRLSTALEDQGKSVYRISGDKDMHDSISQVCKAYSVPN